jgi:hypothetical protein
MAVQTVLLPTNRCALSAASTVSLAQSTAKEFGKKQHPAMEAATMAAVLQLTASG